MLLTWQLNGIIASFVSMYAWSCNIKRPKGVIPEKAQPFYNALLALIDHSMYTQCEQNQPELAKREMGHFYQGYKRKW
jgi:hypothetical protein